MVNNVIKNRQRSLYERKVKRSLDWIASSTLIVLLSPLFALIFFCIKADSKGSILFRQTRVGKNGNPFVIYKFRSMKMGTPNVATAEFENPEDYITKSGRILRKLSLDELPQLFNVWKGDMSFVGPRPLIPDEKYVLQLRHRNGAESVLPGITGLAQVNGRDELKADEKAYWDGEYANKVDFLLDTKILFKTFFDVLQSKGIHEGKH